MICVVHFIEKSAFNDQKNLTLIEHDNYIMLCGWFLFFLSIPNFLCCCTFFVRVYNTRWKGWKKYTFEYTYTYNRCNKIKCVRFHKKKKQNKIYLVDYYSCVALQPPTRHTQNNPIKSVNLFCRIEQKFHIYNSQNPPCICICSFSTYFYLHIHIYFIRFIEFARAQLCVPLFYWIYILTWFTYFYFWNFLCAQFIHIRAFFFSSVFTFVEMLDGNLGQ